jgi:phospholipase/carboxylesterase
MNPHLAAPPVRVGRALTRARRVAVVIHGRGQEPVYMLEHLVLRIDEPDVAWVLPVAAGGSWYPARFSDPRDANEPWLSQALEACEAAIADVLAAGVPPERVVLTGFAQGGCLAAELIAQTPRPYAGAALLTGALIGPEHDVTRPRQLDGLPVFMESSRYDEWVPLDRVEATADALEAAGARVERHVAEDREHRIRDAAVAGVRGLLS